jgi:hypothetical protein
LDCVKASTGQAFMDLEPSLANKNDLSHHAALASAFKGSSAMRKIAR